MSAGQYDQRITTYFGEGVLRAGFMPVPHLLMRHYRRVGLSAAQAMFVLQIMESSWDLGEPPRTVGALAQRMGVDSRTVRKYAEEIRRLGLMRLYNQFDDHGAQVENGYDLTPLFQRLAELVPEVMPRGVQRRRELRQDGPQPVLTLPDATTIAAEIPHPTPSGHGIHGEGGSGDPSSQVPPVLPTTDHLIRSSGNIPSALKRKTNQKQQESSWQELLLSAAGSQKRRTDAAQIVVEQSRNTGSQSLRLGITLTPEEIAHSTRLLQQIGVGEPVRSRIAPTLAPTEVWALWSFGQARCWSINLLISQVYNKTVRARVAYVRAIPACRTTCYTRG
ncbi:MAG: hypothetical protein H0X37_24430 [Herpetosiphonaceae bacterium]|nr:hypothetical protein [Herpetosiphonaceae bacterium]